MSSADSKRDSSPPRIGQYELIARLGSGGMGTVYKARHTGLKRMFALKILSPHRAQAIVLSRAALEAAFEDWDAFEGNLDIRLAESAVRRQAGVAIHSPSLVQHAAVPSLWNGPAHRAVNFDPFFRAALVESS